MKLEILDQAEDDLIEGFHFYESQQAGLGSYFLVNLYGDIESLGLHGGMHLKAYKEYHRLLSRRFPFAVFYKVVEDTVFVHAVLDCRRDPAWIRNRLK
jgi:plasmid stabilization system protein ParE